MTNGITLKKQKITEVIKWTLQQIATGFRGGYKTEEIRFFHPSGHIFLPNGSHYHRGGFIRECNLNANAFVLPEKNTYRIIDKNPGGIIIFDTDTNLRRITDAISDIRIENFSIGNFFEGDFTGDSRMMFNRSSITLALPDLSGRGLLRVAESLLEKTGRIAVLVKNLGSGKIYIIH